MENFTSSSVEKAVMTIEGTDEDIFEEEDDCIICLEPFSSEDPPTITNCKHEYHLQCILEWAQRSKECPICWQLLVLKDPASQDLLAAVEMERSLRSRRPSSTSAFSRIPPEDFDFDPVSYTEDPDFDEHIMQHLTAAAFGRAHHFSRRQRHRSPGLDPSQILVFAASSNESDLQQTYSNTPVESQSSGNPTSPDSNSAPVAMSSGTRDQPTPYVLTSRVNSGSNITDNRHGPLRPGVRVSQTSPGSTQRSRPSELLSFSESLKSKFSAASSRYKESITKSTRGFKEKLLARNNSVKELSKDVQREVTAGIAGVARMMERLDPTSKHTGSSSPVASSVEGTSYLSPISPNGKGVQENLITQSSRGIDAEMAHDTHSISPGHVPDALSSFPGRVEVTHVQDVLHCHGDQT